MGDNQGNFVWYELRTSDKNAAIRFYGDVIGWKTEAFDDQYSIWKAGETPLGGLMPLDAPPHWMGFVGANDVDALTRKAESLGGTTLVPPQDIPTVGRFSVIADPDGAAISLFKGSGEPMPPAPERAIGHFVWRELMANDVERVLRFYSGLLGWRKTEAIESPMGVYQMYGTADRTLGGMMKRPDGYPAPPHWLYYVHVEELDSALEKVRQGGGTVMHGPMDVPGGRVAQCLDPQRAAFALHGE